MSDNEEKHITILASGILCHPVSWRHIVDVMQTCSMDERPFMEVIKEYIEHLKQENAALKQRIQDRIAEVKREERERILKEIQPDSIQEKEMPQ